MIGEVKPQTPGFGTIEQEGLISISAALNICSLCVSLIPTLRRKKTSDLLNGPATKEANLGGKRNFNGRSYWSQKQNTVTVIEWLKDNFKCLFNHGEPDWEWIRENVRQFNVE